MKSSTNNNDPVTRTTTGQTARILAAIAVLGACSLLLFTFLSRQAGRDKERIFIRTLGKKHYQLMVDGKPYVVRGVCYNPIPIGKTHDYDWWSDPAKPWFTDGKLMKDMGVNTVRIYAAGENPEQVKQVIRDLYGTFGIRVILGHWVGFWEYPCPLYGDKEFRERIMQEVLAMVETYKDEPGILCWILGNENNYSSLGTVNPWSSDEIDAIADPRQQRLRREEIYYGFINDIVTKVHAVDARHPVGLGNGELIGLDTASKHAPDIDFVASIIYRGKTFGPLFRSLRATFDKPLMLSEFGADAFDMVKGAEDQNMQAFFLESQWRQIYENLARGPGEGNCLGGTMFEWTDEWWKHEPNDGEGWAVHSTGSNWSNGSYYFDIQAPRNMNMNEEWFGIVALTPQEPGSLDARVPRKAYYVIREFWKNPQEKPRSKQKRKP